MHPISAILFVLALTLSLVACQSRPSFSVPNVIKPYKSEVIQGNFISNEQVTALRVGMPRAQVRNILGTPLLADVFHPNRWDYVFSIERDNVVYKTLRLTVHFDGDQLVRWDGDTMPSETEFVQTLTSGRKIGKIPPLAASKKELADFSNRENAKAKPLATGEETATPNSNRTYPPLEKN